MKRPHRIRRSREVSPGEPRRRRINLPRPHTPKSFTESIEKTRTGYNKHKRSLAGLGVVALAATAAGVAYGGAEASSDRTLRRQKTTLTAKAHVQAKLEAAQSSEDTFVRLMRHRPLPVSGAVEILGPGTEVRNTPADIPGNVVSTVPAYSERPLWRGVYDNINGSVWLGYETNESSTPRYSGKVISDHTIARSLNWVNLNQVQNIDAAQHLQDSFTPPNILHAKNARFSMFGQLLVGNATGAQQVVGIALPPETAGNYAKISNLQQK